MTAFCYSFTVATVYLNNYLGHHLELEVPLQLVIIDGTYIITLWFDLDID